MLFRSLSDNEIGRDQCRSVVKEGSPVQNSFRRVFTDRDRGEGFVLSATTGSSGAGEREHIESNRKNAGGDGPMEGHLFGMGEQVGHGS